METGLKITIAGTDYPVRVSADDGKFRADLGSLHGTLVADSFADLKAKARKIKTPFSLPVTLVKSSGLRHGAVTGIHAGNGNVLLRWDDGTTEQLARWTGGDYLPRLSEQDAAELTELITARNRAVRALEEFVKPRAYTSLAEAAREAQAAAAAGPEART